GLAEVDDRGRDGPDEELAHVRHERPRLLVMGDRAVVARSLEGASALLWLLPGRAGGLLRLVGRRLVGLLRLLPEVVAGLLPRGLLRLPLAGRRGRPVGHDGRPLLKFALHVRCETCRPIRDLSAKCTTPWTRPEFGEVPPFVRLWPVRAAAPVSRARSSRGRRRGSAASASPTPAI